VDEYDFKISSATIRNVMGALDRSGLLYQPHTSAGRVPSNSGYRVYVDELITPDRHKIRRCQPDFIAAGGFVWQPKAGNHAA
jgi:heat-inducible transcriptional repressor